MSDAPSSLVSDVIYGRPIYQRTMMQFCQLVYFADIKVGQYLSRQVLRPSYVISLLLFIPIFILVSFSG